MSLIGVSCVYISIIVYDFPSFLVSHFAVCLSYLLVAVYVIMLKLRFNLMILCSVRFSIGTVSLFLMYAPFTVYKFTL